jgi:hypothetical protein
VYSGTNKAAYRSLDVTGTRLYLRVDDTVGVYADVSGYESMSDIDTGTGPFNGGGSGRWYKSGTADATARGWRVYADSRCFYFYANKGTETAAAWFGDIVSNIPDAYGCGIRRPTNTITTMGWPLSAHQTDARTHNSLVHTRGPARRLRSIENRMP